MMWTTSSPGIRSKSYGSKWLLPFLLSFSLFSAYSLSAQSQSSQPEPSTSYSKMTRDELLTQIESKDKLLAEWLTWQEKVKTSQAELAQASSEQLASRDKLIRDQGFVIEGYKTQQAMGWIERSAWALGGAVVVIGVNALTPKR